MLFCQGDIAMKAEKDVKSPRMDTPYKELAK